MLRPLLLVRLMTRRPVAIPFPPFQSLHLPFSRFCLPFHVPPLRLRRPFVIRPIPGRRLSLLLLLVSALFLLRRPSLPLLISNVEITSVRLRGCSRCFLMKPSRACLVLPSLNAIVLTLLTLPTSSYRFSFVLASPLFRRSLLLCAIYTMLLLLRTRASRLL